MSTGEEDRYLYSPIKLIQFREKIRNNATESNNQLREIISSAKTKGALFYVALCIRNGADMNQYIPYQVSLGAVDQVKEIHILSYAFSVVRSIDKYEDGYPSTLLKMMIKGGSDPSMKNYKNESNSITVDQYLVNNNYVNYFTGSETTEKIDIFLNKTENVEKSKKNNRFIIRCLCSDTSGIFPDKERTFWAHDGLIESIRALNFDTYKFFLDNKLGIMNYPMVSELIEMPTTIEKIKMIEMASEYQPFDKQQADIMDRMTPRNSYYDEVVDKLYDSSDYPYWFKACKEEYRPNRLKRIASYLGIPQSDPMCEKLREYSMRINQSEDGAIELIAVLKEENADLRKAENPVYEETLQKLKLREEEVKKEEAKKNAKRQNSSRGSLSSIGTGNYNFGGEI